MKKNGRVKKAGKTTLTADKLVKTSKKSGIELSERELDKVAGGPTAVELKID